MVVQRPSGCATHSEVVRSWLHEAQAGFRKGRGVDDVVQVTRRIVEEATACQADDSVMLIRLFDIEKAYPRVSRNTLWMLLQRKGAPGGFIKICQALHENTKYSIKIHIGTSSSYAADKGLREGCPSSPSLFNVYHQAVMDDSRHRRQEQAHQLGGPLDHHVHSRPDVLSLKTRKSPKTQNPRP